MPCKLFPYESTIEEKIPTPSSTTKVNIQIEPQYTVLPTKWKDPITYGIHIAPEVLKPNSDLPMSFEEYNAQRQTNNKIMFVVDQSGSMASAMPNIKQVLKKVIQFAQGDAIGIVSFDHRTRVILPLTPLITVEKKTFAVTQIDTLYADGMTDLCAGMMKGLDELWSEGDQTSHRVQPNQEKRYLVLLTDGRTNSGIVKLDEIERQLNSHPFICNTDIYCMALGDTVDQDLLQSIVCMYYGRMYAMRTPDEIAFSFGDCMGSVMSALVPHCELIIRSPFQVHVSAPHVETRDNNESVIVVGTLFWDDKRDFIITISPPGGFEDCAIAEVVLSYRTSDSLEIQKSVPLIPTFAAASPDLKLEPNPYVEKHLLRLKVAEHLQKIAQLISQPSCSLKRSDYYRATSDSIATATPTATPTATLTHDQSSDAKLSVVAAVGEVMNALDDIKDLIIERKWDTDPLGQELLRTIDVIHHQPNLTAFSCRSMSVGLHVQRQTTTQVAQTNEADGENIMPPLYTNLAQRSCSVQYGESECASECTSECASECTSASKSKSDEKSNPCSSNLKEPHLPLLRMRNVREHSRFYYSSDDDDALDNLSPKPNLAENHDPPLPIPSIIVSPNLPTISSLFIPPPPVVCCNTPAVAPPRSLRQSPSVPPSIPSLMSSPPSIPSVPPSIPSLMSSPSLAPSAPPMPSPSAPPPAPPIRSISSAPPITTPPQSSNASKQSPPSPSSPSSPGRDVLITLSDDDAHFLFYPRDSQFRPRWSWR